MAGVGWSGPHNEALKATDAQMGSSVCVLLAVSGVRRTRGRLPRRAFIGRPTRSGQAGASLDPASREWTSFPLEAKSRNFRLRTV